MTKNEMLDKLRFVSKRWGDEAFQYDAESDEEKMLIQQLVDEGTLIWKGAFMWGVPPMQSSYIIKE